MSIKRTFAVVVSTLSFIATSTSAALADIPVDGRYGSSPYSYGSDFFAQYGETIVILLIGIIVGLCLGLLIKMGRKNGKK